MLKFMLSSQRVFNVSQSNKLLRLVRKKANTLTATVFLATKLCRPRLYKKCVLLTVVTSALLIAKSVATYIK